MFLVASKRWMYIPLFLRSLAIQFLTVKQHWDNSTEGRESSYASSQPLKREHLALESREGCYLNKLCPFPNSSS